MNAAYGWNWLNFKGSPEGLKWARKEVQSLDEVLKLVPGRTAVIQAGGNLGIFPKRLAQTFHAVYTFEPAPALFPIMLWNAPEQNIVKFQAALGDRADLISMSMMRRDGRPNNHEGITHVDGPGIIPVIQLDALRLPVCDLIYLDTEGFELYALRGAVETIRRCRPILAVEVNKNLRYMNISEAEVRGFIRGLGYRLVTRLRSDDIYLPAEVAA